MIKVEHVKKVFNKDNVAIDDVSLDLEDGKIIGFIGIVVYTIPFFFVIHMPFILSLLFIVLITLCISFVSFVGLLIDSAFPKLIWDDEADSLRENYNTFIAMGYSLLLFAILCGGGYYLYSHDSITLA